MNAPSFATNAPNKATPGTLPVCRVASRTPAATPQRFFYTLPSGIEVGGEAGHPEPAPIATSRAYVALWLVPPPRLIATSVNGLARGAGADSFIAAPCVLAAEGPWR